MKNITKKLSFFLLFTLIFSFIAACDGGDDSKEIDPDPSPVPPQCINEDFIDDLSLRETGTGVIRGSISSSNGLPVNGVHVRAVNVDNTDLQVSVYSGLDSNLEIEDGAFSIQNLPPGTYRVLIEKMDGRSAAFQTNRISVFVDQTATTLNFPDEYWNGADESDDDNTTDFEPIVVTNGSTVNGIDIITNN